MQKSALGSPPPPFLDLDDLPLPTWTLILQDGVSADQNSEQLFSVFLDQHTLLSDYVNLGYYYYCDYYYIFLPVVEVKGEKIQLGVCYY